jgi:hypothetical protein
MKKLFTLLLIACASIFNVSANQGGPDAFGYTWMDSNEPGGPAYAWFDITQIGSQLSGFGDDNFIGPKPLGGPFTYYWYTVDKCWIGSNGYISFQPGNIAANFPAIPNPTGVNDYITGLMADLMFLGNNNPAKVYYYVSLDTFCMSYHNVPYWSPNFPGYTGSNTFQIILNRADSSITINFQSFSGISQSNVSVGIENSVGNMGLQPLTTLPPNQNYTIKYYYPANPPSVTDGGAMWNNLSSNGGMFFASSGNPYTLKSNIKNTGNTTIGPVNVDAKVRQLNNTVVVGNTAVTGTLSPGQDTTISHTNQFNPPTPGTLRCVTTISGVTGDNIPVNDSIVQELVVVDTTTNLIRLCYTQLHTEPVSGSISWNGGSGGVGMYFKPPTYPARIMNTNFICTGTTTNQYTFYAKIYDDNGPSGTPGTLLDSVAVPTASIITFGVTTVPVGSNVVIGSGGFYVMWDMAGLNASIGQSLTPPFSRHSYETFSNIWSTYRDYQTTDFFIGVDYQKATPEDVGVCLITNPINNATISTPTTVSCWIKNFGTAPDNYFINVNYKLGLSGNTTTEPYTGVPIPAGDSVQFTFTTLLVPPYSAQDNLCVWTSKSTDVNTINDSTCINLTLVGISEPVQLTGIKVYPNPVTDLMQFEFSDALNEDVFIRVTDVLGRIVYEQSVNNISANSIMKMDMSGFSSGMYNYTIHSGNKIKTGKISKI